MTEQLVHGLKLLRQSIHKKVPDTELVEFLMDATSSDVVAAYALPQKKQTKTSFLAGCGRSQVPHHVNRNSESMLFLVESGELLVCNGRGEFFADMFLNSSSASAAALRCAGSYVCFFNSVRQNHYNNSNFFFLSSLNKIVQSLLSGGL